MRRSRPVVRSPYAETVGGDRWTKRQRSCSGCIAKGWVAVEIALARLADENLRLRWQLAAIEHERKKRTCRDCFCQVCLNRCTS